MRNTITVLTFENMPGYLRITSPGPNIGDTMQSIQPSTVRNLAALAGEGREAINYGKDIADLLAGDDTLRPDEADLFAAAVGSALAIAAGRRSGDMFEALRATATYAVAALAALRGWGDDERGERLLLVLHVQDAVTFQLTDVAEQD